MARDHHRGLVALDPLRQLDVAEKTLAAPTGRRFVGWRVMHPDPPLRPRSGGVAELIVNPLFDQRSIPPRADREQSVADAETAAIAGDSEFADLADPARDLFAFRTTFVEIVISGADDHAGDAGQQRQILFHHDNLGAEIYPGADVQSISGEYDEVEQRCGAEQPIELRQRIVQIGHDEAAHLENNPVLKKQARRKSLRNPSQPSKDCAEPEQGGAADARRHRSRWKLKLAPFAAETPLRSACRNARRS